jgi:hypothetical protein
MEQGVFRELEQVLHLQRLPFMAAQPMSSVGLKLNG